MGFEPVYLGPSYIAVSEPYRSGAFEFAPTPASESFLQKREDPDLRSDRNYFNVGYRADHRELVHSSIIAGDSSICLKV